MRNFKTIFALSILMFSLLIGVNNSNAAALAPTLKGKILLQVEQKGEAWYVNPINSARYYLGRPADAFNVIKELGLGISTKDLVSFNGYAPKRLSGRILLQVEDFGKAWYVNPDDLKLYYLGKPADAFKVMRELGLGITDKNLGLISVATDMVGWKVYTNASQGFSFKYPEILSNLSIHAQVWPPRVKITTGVFSCNPAGETQGRRTWKTTTNPAFCVESRSEGAAGTAYTDYSYTALYGGKLITFDFTIGYANCDNYGDTDNKTACEKERAKFNPDSLVSQIFSTFKFTK